MVFSILPPGSWGKIVPIIAAVFIISSVWLLQLNRSVHSEVERLRLSLLRCADSKKREAVGEGEVEKQEERGLAEQCVYQYNLTLSFETTMGRTVMLDWRGVELICSILTRDMDVLEYGSGGSTTFFSQFVRSWTSIEHDSNWEPKMTDEPELALDVGWSSTTSLPLMEGRTQNHHDIWLY